MENSHFIEVIHDGMHITIAYRQERWDKMDDYVFKYIAFNPATEEIARGEIVFTKYESSLGILYLILENLREQPSCHFLNQENEGK